VNAGTYSLIDNICAELAWVNECRIQISAVAAMFDAATKLDTKAGSLCGHGCNEVLDLPVRVLLRAVP